MKNQTSENIRAQEDGLNESYLSWRTEILVSKNFKEKIQLEIVEKTHRFCLSCDGILNGKITTEAENYQFCECCKNKNSKGATSNENTQL